MEPMADLQEKLSNVNRDHLVTAALIQTQTFPEKEKNINLAVNLIAEAAASGAQIICLQEMFYCQYFASQQNLKWLSLAETVPGPTTTILQEIAAKHKVVIIAPFPEKGELELYYNTTVVIDADGSYLGKYRKIHLPHMTGFWEKYYFRPGNLGYPVFSTIYGKIGILQDYDRNYPEAARILALSGAEMIFIPCTTVIDLSYDIWFIVQRSHAVLNGVFVGTSNRIGKDPWSSALYYGTSYFCSPGGRILAQGSQNNTEVVLAELDLNEIARVRNRWHIFRDLREETYAPLMNQNL